jgi:hydrogenase maturation protease
MSAEKNILILGLGNEILTDDSIGPRLGREICKDLNDERITFETAAIGGLELVEMIRDYKKVIIIDAIKTLHGKPGDVYFMTPASFKETSNISNIHDISFLTALELAKELGISVPSEILIIAVEIVEDLIFSTELTPEVNARYPEILKEVKEMLSEMIA